MNDKGIGQLSGLAGRLVAEGLISAEEATEAQREASMEQVPLVSFLVEKKNVCKTELDLFSLTGSASLRGSGKVSGSRFQDVKQATMRICVDRMFTFSMCCNQGCGQPDF